MFNLEIFKEWLAGFNYVINFATILYMIWGTFLGIIVGAIPGLTSSMATVILLPITFYLAPINALVFLCAIYVSAMYGGALTAILLNTPGTSESFATTIDGYQMTLQGKSNEAMGLAIGASLIGGIISYIFLLVAMYPIAIFAMKFGSTEMFLVAIFGITIIASLKGESFSKGLLAGLLGLLIGTIGICPTGEWRSTFGNIYLADGVHIIPPIVGLFAMSELFFLAEKEFIIPIERKEKRSIQRIIKGIGEVFRYPGNIIRSSIIGIIIGAIPATGATIASITSYNIAKSSSKHPEKFGKGFPEGIVAPETANNASTGGALMTTLVLGIPGSTTTAVILGALIMQGLRPGPTLLSEQSEIVYGLIMALFLSQIFMVIMASLAGYFFSNILVVPTYVLVPVITIFCMVGSFAGRNTMFDVYIMFAFGILGWVMRAYGYPPVAVVLGIILGPIADAELIRAYMRFGNKFYLEFIKRPISLALLIIIFVSVLIPFLRTMLIKQKK